MMKHVFIINPISGKGKTLKVAENIEKVCQKENLDYEINYTNYPGEATKIAKKYRLSKNIIYSVGGDGTLNEVLNGIVGTKNMLAVIPSGSGNDFYKTLSKIDDELPNIDIGKINDKYFINIVSIGIDAEVANNVSLMKKKNIPTSQIYNASLVYTFFKYKFKNIEMSIDENDKKKANVPFLQSVMVKYMVAVIK
jgi:diacylglycerol kinase (ATP)